ncbi:MAG TPA: sugar phosphate nucleotidyltransferase [Candidatus Nanoarchaeia archaeon]|nr:sugar phosphate nucleotidyltransferase [Candidatus Nanoarchaeia archaeon]
MKAVILAAGKGTRMLPLTKSIPKVLVKINGKPFLYYVIKTLQNAGFDDVVLIVGYKQEKIKEFLSEYHFSAKLIEQKEQLGTGHAIALAKGFVGKDNFLVYYGDSLFSVADLQLFCIDDDLTYMAGKEVSDWKKYGILQVKDGYLQKTVEKPSSFVGNVAWPGFFKSTPLLFKKLSNIGVSPRGEIEVTDAINLLAQEKKVKVLPLQDYWLDLSSPEDIPKIEKFLKEKWKE